MIKNFIENIRVVMVETTHPGNIGATARAMKTMGYDNLYLVKTPEQGKNGMSCIEDFFDPSLLSAEINGKKFNPEKDHGADGEYGKAVFADKVIRPNADKIDFSNFAPLLERVAAVIDHYSPPAMPEAATP